VIATTAWLDACVLGLVGLLVGSFLNVVVHRLPKMMELRWAAECADFQAADVVPSQPPPPQRFNLMVPRSRCPNCGHLIRWYENIPVASYLFLRARCSACRTPISARYPLIEILNSLMFAWCGWRWGVGITAVAWCAFSAAVLTLACIDWDTTLLPDDITLPLLWVGLCSSAASITSTALPDALWGAVAGYLSLWSVYWIFKFATGKEGMGYGDFKLFAALGAWFGWQALIPMILMASLIGAIIGIGMKVFALLREGGYMPFGPFLALAGLTSLLFGPQSILTTLGL